MNYFKLFGLEEIFDLKKDVLDDAYIALRLSDCNQEKINFAYEILKNDLTRGKHIFDLAGIDLQSIQITKEMFNIIEHASSDKEALQLEISKTIDELRGGLTLSSAEQYYEKFCLLKYLMKIIPHP